jgi:hypothetical protein
LLAALPLVERETAAALLGGRYRASDLAASLRAAVAAGSAG